MIDLLISITLKSSLIFIVFVILKKIIGDKLNAGIAYRLWLCLFIIVCLPISFESHLSLENVIEVPKIVEMNMTAPRAEMNYDLFDTGGQELNATTQSKSQKNPLQVIYIVGLIASLLRVAWVHSKLRRSCKLTDFEPLDEVKTLLNYKKSIKVYETDQVNSPAAMGVFRKRILMPLELMDQLKDEDYKYILMHEIMHLKQNDHIMNYLLLLYKSIFWFNPLTHLFFYLIKEDMEFACDHKLMIYFSQAEKKSYGHLLLDIATHISNEKYVVVSPFINNRKVLGMRIKKMMYNKKHSKILLLLLLLALIVTGVMVLTKPISKDEEETKTVVNIEESVLDLKLAREILDDNSKAAEIMINFTPQLTTDYRDFNNNSVLEERRYELADDQTKVLKIITKLEVLESVEMIDANTASLMTLLDTPYVIQRPLINTHKQLIEINDAAIGEEVSTEILQANATKFIYRTSESEKEVYLIEDGQQALSILTENARVLDYRYFSLDDYDINLEILFWDNFYRDVDFDYDRFKTEVLPQLMPYIKEDVDLRKNIMPLAMGDFYHIFLNENYTVRIKKDMDELFYIKFPENIHYDAEEGLDELTSRAIAEQYIQTSPLGEESFELLNVNYENLFDSTKVEYYVFDYAFEQKGVFIKVNTRSKTIAEITLYNKE